MRRSRPGQLRLAREGVRLLEHAHQQRAQRRDVAGRIAVHVGRQDRRYGRLGRDHRRSRLQRLEQRQPEPFAQCGMDVGQRATVQAPDLVAAAVAGERQLAAWMPHATQRRLVVAGEHEIDRVAGGQRRPRRHQRRQVFVRPVVAGVQQIRARPNQRRGKRVGDVDAQRDDAHARRVDAGVAHQQRHRRVVVGDHRARAAQHRRDNVTPIGRHLALGVLRKLQVDQVVHRHEVRHRDDARHVRRGKVGQARAQPQQRERKSDLLGQVEVVARADLGPPEVGRDARQQAAQRAHVREHPGRRVRGLANVERDVGVDDHARRSALARTTTRYRALCHATKIPRQPSRQPP